MSKLIAEGCRGEDVVIAGGEEPVVQLMPDEAAKPRQAGRWKGRIALTPAFFEPLHA